MQTRERRHFVGVDIATSRGTVSHAAFGGRFASSAA
jgi:hypothetical protein